MIVEVAVGVLSDWDELIIPRFEVHLPAIYTRRDTRSPSSNPIVTEESNLVIPWAIPFQLISLEESMV